MIVFKSPFPRDITPWNISRVILFWLPEEDAKIKKLGDFLAFGKSGSECIFSGYDSISYEEMVTRIENSDNNNTVFYKLLQKINNRINKIDYVKIHEYDVWNGDETLIDIIYPILLMYKKHSNGSPNVDDEDVPDTLKSHSSFENDENVHEKWSYVVDEMIFALDPKNNDHMDIKPNSELSKRLENGRMLFGKYMNSLWT